MYVSECRCLELEVRSSILKHREWHEGDTEFKIEAAAKRMLKSRQLTELVPVVRVYRGSKSSTRLV